MVESKETAILGQLQGAVDALGTQMKGVLLLLDKVIDTDVPVLIQGESGTGKELIARAIHYNGPRRAKAFV